MLCVGALKILLDSSNIRSDYFISMQKKAEFIQQEVFARLLMYNFTELITALAAIHRDDKRYTSLNCCVLYALVKGRFLFKSRTISMRFRT